MNTFHLTAERIAKFAAVIRKHKPRIVDGYASSLYVFAELFYDVLSVRQFQVVQKPYSTIAIRIVRSNSLDDVPVGPITEALRQSVGLSIDVDFVFTDRIKPSPTGKHHFTVSEVKPLL